MRDISYLQMSAVEERTGNGDCFPWAILGALLFAALLCWQRLADESLWLDEIYTIWTARLSWLAVPAAALASGSHAPLWFWITHPFVTDGPAQEFLLRFPAACAGIVAVAAAYALGRALFGCKAGVWGACLVALAPVMVRYSQEARMYSALAAATLLSAAFLWRYVHRWRLADGLGFLVSTTAALYLSYFALFAIAAEMLFLIAALWLPLPGTRDEAPTRRLARIALAWSGVGVLFLPWAVMALRPFLSRQTSLSQSVAGWQVTVTLPFVLNLLHQLLGGSALALLLSLLFVASCMLLLYRRRWLAAGLAGAWVAIPWLVILLLQPRRFYVRYMIMLQPMIAITVGAGLQQLSDAVVRWRAWRWPLQWRKALLTALIAGGIGMAHIGPLMTLYTQQQNEDWRGVAEYLAREAAPGAVVLCHGEAPGRDGDEGRVRIGLGHYLPRWEREDIQLIGVDEIEKIFQEGWEERELWGVLWHHAPLGQPSLPSGWEETEFTQVLAIRTWNQTSPSAVTWLLEAFLIYLPNDAPRYHTELALAKVSALAGDEATAREYLDAADRIRPGGSYADRAWQQAIRIVEEMP